MIKLTHILGFVDSFISLASAWVVQALHIKVTLKYKEI